jgi:ribonuclease PH
MRRLQEVQMRPSGRAADELRTIRIETGVNRYAEGSCLISVGETRLICTASVEERVPPFLRGSGQGWVTAEYGMLPRATSSRNRREASVGKQGGRTQEIQRLIGRALRAGTDRQALGERQITIDCDVLQADGGTRCAAITGGWVALKAAVRSLQEAGAVRQEPLSDPIVAISCGVYAGRAVLDLDYAEDSEAGTDANFVLTGGGRLVEVQASAEGAPFDPAQLSEMMQLASSGVPTLVEAQRTALAR